MALPEEWREWDLVAYAKARPELARALAGAANPSPPDAGKLRRASGLTRKSYSYLWHPYLPVGELSGIAGEGESGKTWTALKMAAEVSRGGEMPAAPGRKRTAPFKVPASDVILIQQESDESATILPRFVDLGGDAERLILPKDPFRFSSEKAESGVAGLETIESYLLLAWYIEASESRYVFMDPITSLLTCRLASEPDVRVALERLQVVARFTGASIAYVIHLNKDYEAPVKHRVLYSVAFFNVPRSVLLASEDPEGSDDENIADLLIFHGKNNLGKKGGPLAYRLTGDIEVPGDISWEWRDADQDTDATKVSKALNGDSGSAETRRKPGQVRDELVKILFAAEGLTATPVLKDLIAEHLDWDGVNKSAWQRATASLPFKAVEVVHDDDLGHLVESPGSGKWGYRPLGEVRADGAVYLAEVASGF